MTKYGQFCPVAKAAAILGERWTLLIVRELLGGATQFSELQRGLARASPSIITKRLRELEEAGVISRTIKTGRCNTEYHLTPAGEELMPLIELMGSWATRWVSDRLQADELDEYLLMADMQRRIRVEALPRSSAVLHFHFSNSNKHPKWWLVVSEGEIDVCDEDPGLEPSLYINTPIKLMVEVWLGKVSLRDAFRSGRLKISGRNDLSRSMHRWLGYSVFAGVSQ